MGTNAQFRAGSGMGRAGFLARRSFPKLGHSTRDGRGPNRRSGVVADLPWGDEDAEQRQRILAGQQRLSTGLAAVPPGKMNG